MVMIDDEFDDLFAESQSPQASSEDVLCAQSTFDDPRDDITASNQLCEPVEQDLSTCNVDFTRAPSLHVHTSPRASDKQQQNLHSPLEGTWPRPQPADRLTVLGKVEEIFQSVLGATPDDNEHLEICLKTRLRYHMKKSSPDDRVKCDDVCNLRRLRFPGKSAEDAWRFTVVLRILEFVYDALRHDTVVSKRDIYYRDPALFGKQSAVDRYVDDIAYSFGVPRSALNITATSKGLVAGAVILHRRNGSSVNAADDREGLAIPHPRDLLCVDLPAVKWILVVEKEATFRSIASSPLWSEICTEGVLLTGKGYPDIKSRALLHLLGTASPLNGFASPRLLGLVDYDPDGLAILSTYRNGSLALHHESDMLCTPGLDWIGLHSEHLQLDRNDTNASQGLMPLTRRDRAKAVRMLERSSIAFDGDKSTDCALQTMLMLNMKAELQMLDTVPSGTLSLLRKALLHD